jgi:hypothetical protein
MLLQLSCQQHRPIRRRGRLGPKAQAGALEQITRQIGADLATVSLVMLVAVSVAAVVVAASTLLTPRKAGP